MYNFIVDRVFTHRVEEVHKEACEDKETLVDAFDRCYADHTGEYPTDDCYNNFNSGKTVEYCDGFGKLVFYYEKVG